MLPEDLYETMDPIEGIRVETTVPFGEEMALPGPFKIFLDTVGLVS